MNPLEITYVNSKKISCSGSDADSRHPLVYLNIGKDNFVICPYCGKHFINKNHSKTNQDIKRETK
jgi:uncharacterized Zn-finger protein